MAKKTSKKKNYKQAAGKQAEPKASKTCPKCGQNKPMDGFSKDSRRKDGKYIYCRECESARQKEKNARLRKAASEIAGDVVVMTEEWAGDEWVAKNEKPGELSVTV